MQLLSMIDSSGHCNLTNYNCQKSIPLLVLN